jgi:hypothetical protein
MSGQSPARAFATGNDSPIYDLFFFDNLRGWAVGGYGTILTTRDGGQTWRPQREFERGGDGALRRRAMVLGVASSAAELPWSVLASESLESGRRVAAAIRDTSGQASGASDNLLAGDPLERCRDAATRVGGGEVVAWNPKNIDAILAAYRPSVLVLASDVPADQHRHWISAAMRAGVIRVFDCRIEKGADGAASSPQRADLTLPSSAVLPVAAAISGDLWKTAIEIVEPHRGIGTALALNRRWDQSQSESVRSGVAEGLPSGGALRTIADGRMRNLQVLQARSSERVLVDRLFQQAAGATAATLSQRLELLMAQSPADNRPRLLRTISRRCEVGGDAALLRLYMVTLEYAAKKYADSGLGRWSQLRIDAMRTSDEWRSMMDRWIDADLAVGSRSVGQQSAGGGMIPSHGSPFERRDSREGSSTGVVQASAIGSTSRHGRGFVTPSGAVLDVDPSQVFGLPRNMGELPRELAGEFDGEFAGEFGGEPPRVDGMSPEQTGQTGQQEQAGQLGQLGADGWPVERAAEYQGDNSPGTNFEGPRYSGPGYEGNDTPAMVDQALVDLETVDSASGDFSPGDFSPGDSSPGDSSLRKIADGTEGSSAAGNLLGSLGDAQLRWRLHPAYLLWKQTLGGEAIDGFDQMIIDRYVGGASTAVWGGLLGGRAERPIRAVAVGGSGIDSQATLNASPDAPLPSIGGSGRPLLDGKLDEPCWGAVGEQTPEAGEPISDGDLPRNEVRDIRFAYDGEFLFVGLRERFFPGDQESVVERRQRDAELSGSPRVVIELDVDRDLITSYRLTVDSRGRTRDTCDGFTGWQPRWYVATAVENGIRTVELAIRRDDLVALPPVRGDRWRIRATRYAAGTAAESGSMPTPGGWRDLNFD